MFAKKIKYSAISSLIFAVVPALAQAAAGPSNPANYPPAGLYQTDMDSTITMLAGSASISTHLRTDGKTGDAVSYQTGNGQRTPDRLFKGKGPITLCQAEIKAGTALAATPALAALAACPNQSTSYNENGYVHKAICPASEMTLTVQKIDTDTWEFTTDTTTFQNPTGPDISGMRFILEQTIKNGATEKERAAASKQLAELPEMQRKISEGQANMIAKLKEKARTAKDPEEAAMLTNALAKLSGRTPLQHAIGKERRTRISNFCDFSVKK
ncbi:MAG: hypothetical protein V4447_11245 [Pseudomonadota bacterium]